MNTAPSVQRDERTVAVENASYRWAYLFLSFGLLALVAYILFGTVALKHGRSKRVRAAAFALALTTVLYIVSVALTRNPLGFLALL